MAKYSVLQTFYASDAWRNFRLLILNERGLRCEYCGERVAQSKELTLHHKTELTPDNYEDVTIALNPTNIMVVHHGCHNSIHKRSAAKLVRAVFMVYGPPLAGKKTYTQDRMWPGDLIVDIDAIYTAISGQPWYSKPDSLLKNVRVVHSQLLDNIRTRFGRWDRAWILGGYPDKYKREKLADDLGAELVFIEASKDQCLERLKTDPIRKKHEAEWTGYIDKWFLQHTN
ncbi:HNH endonuclease signature motif containing protein [Desulfosporosinus sp.]|uniref:HNH endonuclease signature motif containing protein n=1 Tax=Desulfosporosinus sp. TaxID=157907 RepID=UPI0025C58366|nr:HNH endonuclease signature motif containing protein [Desulfosporosinus sp.]MBC2722023.1 HNH endonuclease [Desulfosporosinus sp.]MBC2728006.1 HNH endonuclease [Desulfosporosinus sp.]